MRDGGPDAGVYGGDDDGRARGQAYLGGAAGVSRRKGVGDRTPTYLVVL